ncbi:MAG: GNAT family N-acetyltransferase [Candidatus Bipolaricaulia bacterium]
MALSIPKATIRRARPGDLDKIYQIERRSFPTPWPKILLRRYLREEGFLAYEIDEQVVGYVISDMKHPSWVTRLEQMTLKILKHPSWDAAMRVGHIKNLAVDPSFRKRGIGKALLEETLNYLKDLKADSVELEVRTDNRTAFRLYIKYGFAIKRKIHRYYQNGDDAFLMIREL